MKKMTPFERKFKAKQIFDKLLREGTCRFGKWNVDKILFELERVIKHYRRSCKQKKEV